MEKLLGNCNSAIWKNIKQMNDTMLSETEEKLGIKFPQADIKYIKAYNNARAINVILSIKNKKFKIESFSLKIDMLEINLEFFLSLKETYFPKRKLIPIFSTDTVVEERNLSDKEFLTHYEGYEVVYDFTNSDTLPNMVLITYEEEVTTGEKFERHFIEGTIKEHKIENAHSLKDLFEYMYITDEKVEKEEVFYIFRETATENEIKEFQEELGIKFPENYENMLSRAREEGVRLYPQKWKVKVPRGVMEYDTGMYIDLKNIKETYEIFLEEHKPYPKKLIPIALYGNGDYACLDYRGKLNTTLKEPKITYYVHDEIGNRRFIHLADSYDEFLDMIEIDEEEIERREKEIEESYFYGEQPLEDD